MAEVTAVHAVNALTALKYVCMFFVGAVLQCGQQSAHREHSCNLVQAGAHANPWSQQQHRPDVIPLTLAQCSPPQPMACHDVTQSSMHIDTMLALTS